MSGNNGGGSVGRRPSTLLHRDGRHRLQCTQSGLCHSNHQWPEQLLGCTRSRASTALHGLSRGAHTFGCWPCKLWWLPPGTCFLLSNSVILLLCWPPPGAYPFLFNTVILLLCWLLPGADKLMCQHTHVCARTCANTDACALLPTHDTPAAHLHMPTHLRQAHARIVCVCVHPHACLTLYFFALPVCRSQRAADHVHGAQGGGEQGRLQPGPPWS